jgi:prepilin-type N-terminal cleavage/methylation domain-containing protein
LGFTLVELLVVIAIVGTLVALLLPAVQAAREAARRASCNNNQRQFVLSLHQHHDARKAFPAGASRPIDPNTGLRAWTRNSMSWIVKLLPFLEQQNISDRIDHQADSWQWVDAEEDVLQNTEISNTPLALALCPSDGTSDWFHEYGAPTNYVACYGSSTADGNLPGVPGKAYPEAVEDAAPDGAFYIGEPVRMRQIVDGNSQSLAFSECLRGFPLIAWVGESQPLCLTPNHGITGYLQDRGGAWLFSVRNQFWGFSTYYPPNHPAAEQAECVRYSGTGVFGARSNHPGGVVASLCDGAIRFVSETIEPTTWQALGTINRGEIVDAY